MCRDGLGLLVGVVATEGDVERAGAPLHHHGVCRRRLLSQAVARSDGAVDTLRLKDEGEVADPVDVTGRVRNIQPKHASWTEKDLLLINGVPGDWRQGLSPACRGADARRDREAPEPAALLVGVVNDELQRARITGPGDVDMKTDAHERERPGQARVIDQDAVWAAVVGAAPGDQVPSRPIRVPAVDSGTADVSQRDNPAGGFRRFGGLRDSALVVRRKR